MLSTAELNLQLTSRSAGKRHIADYLPPEELARFMQTAEAAKTGTLGALRSEGGGAHEGSKLTADNVGYQMLVKGGWEEGSALGSAALSSSGSSSGRLLEPLTAQGAAVVGAGVGVQSTHEPSAGDDEFDQYRKRMQLAYRFRPNPMNNPRRNYY